MPSTPYTSPQILQSVDVRLEEGMLAGGSALRTVRTVGILSYEVDEYEENEWVDESDPNIVWD